MKRFLALFSMALVLTVVISLSVLTLHSSAQEEIVVLNDVIYIKDTVSGTGDGSSSANAMGNLAQTDAGYDGTNFYKNTALYRAAEKLSKVGGTIVICGSLEIGNVQCTGFTSNPSNGYAEFVFPKSDKTLCITSKYDNEDYTEVANLTLSGKAVLILNAPTVFENIKLYTNSGDRVICCNGNKTVFGDGIDTDNPNSTSFISIAGGTRYKAMTGDTNITIKSGTYFNVVGSSWGINSGSYTHTGDSKITIEGGTFKNGISGGSRNVGAGANMDGNVDIIIKDGTINTKIYGAGAGGFINEDAEVNIKIYGGTFSQTSPIADRFQYDSNGVNNVASKTNVDLSEASNVQNSQLNNIITSVGSLSSNKNIMYPAKWVNTITLLSVPSNKVAFVGDTTVSSDGAVLNVTYKNEQTNTAIAGTYTVRCNIDNVRAFNAKCNTTTEAEGVTVEYYYGDQSYHKEQINVIKAPDVEIEGAQIKTTEGDQQIRFKANYTNKYSSYIETVECGIISIASDMLISDEYFNHKQSAGMYDGQPVKTETNGYKDLYQTTTDRMKTEFTVLGLGGGVIRENNYCTNYKARAYVKIIYNGEEYYRYSEIIERNPYQIAKKAINNENESAGIKQFLQSNLVDVSYQYSENVQYASQTRVNELRNKVVAYMRNMANIEWTPTETFIIYNDSSSNGTTQMKAIFRAGVTYKGLPYINYTMSQVETFKSMSELDGAYIPLESSYVNLMTNESNLDKLLTAEQKEAGRQNFRTFPGNDCITSVILSWNTVLNNREEIQKMNTTYDVLSSDYCGVIPVGNYYDFNDIPSYNTVNAITNIGKREIVKAYKELQKGDAIIYINSNGGRHARLVLSVDGAINDYTNEQIDNFTDSQFNWLIQNSSVNCIDQAAGASNRYIFKNTQSSIQEKSSTFEYLLEYGYLPITIPELATGNSDTEFTYVTGLNLDNTLPNGKLSGIVKSNRQIISVTAAVKQGENELFKHTDNISLTVQGTANTHSYHTGEYDLSGFDFEGFSFVPGETYTVDLHVVVSGLIKNDGTISSGCHLIQNYTFTAK